MWIIVYNESESVWNGQNISRTEKNHEKFVTQAPERYKSSTSKIPIEPIIV